MATKAQEVGRIDLLSGNGETGAFSILCESSEGGDAYVLSKILAGREAYRGFYSSLNDVRNAWQGNLKELCTMRGYRVLRVVGLALKIERQPGSIALDQLPNASNELSMAPVIF